MEPRLTPTWHNTDEGDEQHLIAYIGPLDIYYEDSEGEPWLIVVGPAERKKNGTMFNFDVYAVEDGRLESRDGENDIHIELHEMCELYKLAVERGYIREN